MFKNLWCVDHHQRYYFVSILLVSIVVFCYLMSIGPIFASTDSHEYINASPVRLPVYPLLLQLSKVLFEQNYYPLIFFQILLGFAGAISIVQFFYKQFALPKSYCLVLFLLFLSPYFYGDYKFGNRILTESLSYPLFMITVILLFNAVAKKNAKNFIWANFCLLILLLTRSQFLFLVPVFGVVGFFIKRNSNFAKRILLTLIVILTMASSNLIVRSYQYALTKHFSPTPFSGFTYLTTQMYLSNKGDAKLFKQHSAERKIFIQGYNELYKKNENLAAFNNKRLPVEHFYHHFAGSFNPILYRVMMPIIKRENHTNDPYLVNKISTHMAFTLLKANYINYIKLVAFSIKNRMGGYYLALALMALILISFIYYIRFNNQNTFIIFIISLMQLGNYMLVAMVEPFLMRYCVYTEILLVSLITCMMYEYFQYSNKAVQ